MSEKSKTNSNNLSGAKIDDTKLKEILIRENYITKDDFEDAERLAKTHNTSTYSYLITNEIITKDLVGQAIAESFGVPYADLNSKQPSQEQILKLPEILAKKFRVVLFEENEKEITITTDNPNQEQLLIELQMVFPAIKIIVAYSLSEDINTNLKYYQKPLEARISHVITRQKQAAPAIIEQILSDALARQASDIHFEPQPNYVVIRFRIDGILQLMGRIPREYYENILNCIKVQSHMRIDVHFSAQDGSMYYEKNNVVTDIRTSIMPTTEGEKIVLRILAAYIEGFALTELGLSDKNKILLEKATQKTFGMIIIAGPTGSGKTTTLYAVIKTMNQSSINITTIEDPVEYKILGINQIQVNTQTNLTFARGLRSIFRQDPNVILVGEIRDRETAEIAVNAALTGHLLFSTFHANDAATAIPRLLDMGTEPFLLASTLEMVIAQRLVRKICEQCRYGDNLSSHNLKLPSEIINKYLNEKDLTLYKGKGCDHCGHTGYRGRIGIFEFIKVTPAIQNIILKRPSAQEIWQLARQQGSVSLFEDGIDKVKNGITTITEVMRMAEAPAN